MKLVITRGLPASGKSTWAREWAAEDEVRRARVNRDDLRHMICGRYWPAPENTVTVAEKAVVRALLESGRDVVVDATHLRMAHAKEMAKLARELGAEFEVKDFPTDVDECIRRDAERARRGERAVGQEAIKSMAVKFALRTKWLPPVVLEEDVEPPYKYIADTTRPSAWLVDIDGTLAHMNGRGPFDWHRVGEDDIDPVIADILYALNLRDDIVFLSGRDASCAGITERWLETNLPRHPGDEWIVTFGYNLFMRPAKDTRKDSIVKLELFREHVAPRFNVLGVLDDRNQVVKMWRSIGLKCLQVAEGDF